MSIDNNDWDDDMDESDFDDIFDSNIDEKILEKYELILKGEKCSLSEEDFEDLISYHHLDDKKVLEVLEFAIEYYPYNKDFHFDKLMALNNTEQDNESFEFVESCLEKFNDDYRFYFFYAKHFQKTQDNENAIKNYLEAIKIGKRFNEDQSSPSEFYLFDHFSFSALIIDFSIFMMTIDRENEVFEMLNDIMIKNHTSSGIYTYLFVNIFSNGLNQKGLKYIEQLINIAPYNYLAWFTKGKIEQMDEQMDKAIESVEYAHLINPKFTDASFFLGDYYENIKDYNKAIEYYKITVESEIERGAENDFTLLRLSRCYFEIGRYEQTRQFLNKSDYFNDFNPEFSFLYGMSFMMENQFRKALPFIKKAYQLDKAEIEYILPLVNLYCFLNETEKLKKLIKELKKNKDFDFIERWYEIASIIFHTNQTEFLEEFLEDIMENHPDCKIQVSAFLNVISYSLKPTKTEKKEIVRKYYYYPILMHELCELILKEDYENDVQLQALKEFHKLN